MRALALTLMILALPVPGAAYCRLALSLAVDVSSSVDEAEYALQKNGLLAALSDPEVADAFFRVPGAYVALHVFEWSGRYQQDVMLDWTAIVTPDDLRGAVLALAARKRSYAEFPTALGYALGFASFEFRRVPGCERRKIDVSGDGVNNDGFPPQMARNNHDLDTVTVNGLVIGDDPDVMRFYRNSVIMGPGAFVEHAATFADFEDAMRRKLIRELGEPQLGLLAR